MSEDQPVVPRGHYLRSNGDLQFIPDMIGHHLRAAHAKTLREMPWRITEIEDMAAEIARREAEKPE